jgi:hypothetical protein
MSVSVLSPLAPPFHPMFEPINIAIYNDGIPSMCVIGTKAELEILHGIPDDAIDEQFPPTAEDAAEIEATERFVEIMASLALLEEMEEKARMSFCHIKKRWEARRAEGLHGKPRPPRREVSPVDHSNTGMRKQMRDTSIVPFKHAHYFLLLTALEQRERAKMAARRSSSQPGMKAAHGHKPIQQPRKNH